jgi:hypothetical protein
MRKNIVNKEHGAKNFVSPKIIKETKDEAIEAAKNEAIKNNVSPAAVMYSSPDGAVTGDIS